MKEKQLNKWYDELVWCPSQCYYYFMRDGDMYCIYLRWRHQDPWTADIIKCADGDFYINNQAATWKSIEIPFFKDSELDKLKEYIKSHLDRILGSKNMTDQLEEQKNNFLLDVWAAMRRNQVVVIIVYNSEENDYFIMSNKHCTDFDETIKTFCELPFLGRVSPENTFGDWEEYFDDVALAEIYGFELEDGQVQIAILDKYIKPSEKTVIHEAYCSKELGGRLFLDGYYGDTVKGLHIPDDECEYDIDASYVSMSCAMRWLREVKGVYINIRMTFGEHVYATEPKLHFVADICDTKTGKWLDNDIWEETYEKCVEAAINYYYYDYKNEKEKPHTCL